MNLKGFVAIGVAALAVAGAIGWRFRTKATDTAKLQQNSGGRRGPANVRAALAGPRLIENTLQVVGTVNSPYNIKLSPKTAGIITDLTVREGDAVHSGQVVFRIDQTEILGQVLAAQAAAAEARQRLAQAQITQNANNVGVTTQIRQQEASLGSSRADFGQVRQNYAAQIAAAQGNVTDADAKVAAAQSAIQSAQANLEAANANLANAKVKFDRMSDLYKQGFAAAQDVDDARTTMQVQVSAVNVAQKQVDAANSALRSAQAVRHSAAQQVRVIQLKAQSDVAASKAKVTQSEASLQMASANRAQTPAYQANIDALRATVAAADAQVKQAQARLGDTDIRSPIDGVVTSRTADPGSVASPGQPAITVQFLKWVFVDASVPVENSSQVHPGMTVAMTFDALPGQSFSGTIADVNPSADSQSRQFLIRIRRENPDGRLRPGMFGHITLVLSRTPAAVAVPREAVTIDPSGQATVYVIDSANKVHLTKVTLGAQDATGYEITDGLKAGANIVIQTYQPLRDGQQVRMGGQTSGKADRSQVGGAARGGMQ